MPLQVAPTCGRTGVERKGSGRLREVVKWGIHFSGGSYLWSIEVGERFCGRSAAGCS